MKLVVKFDGNSISTSNNIQTISEYLLHISKENQIAVICSAINDTTDNLIHVAEFIKSRNKKKTNQIITKIVKKHKQIAIESIKKKSILKKSIKKLDIDLSELEKLSSGLFTIGEVTPRSLDYLISFGERLSINIISSVLNNLGCLSESLTGKDVGITTDSNFGESKLLVDTTKLYVSKTINSLFAKKITPIIGGFVGADQYGNITTFGRGGSDYTATIIASCIDADEIWFMGSVDGLMTADHAIVKRSKVIKEISYAEAVEMAIFGVKHIHPRTFEPLFTKKIPMRIRNAFNIKNNGTYVTSHLTNNKNPIKCVSVIKHNGLIDVRGGNMVGIPGTAAKIFLTLANVNVNVMMISQNPSESSISIVVKKSDLDKAVNSLEINLLGKMVKNIDVTTNVATVALIGSGMRGTIGIASRVFSIISKKNVNVVMIAQGSSELNLSFIVKDSDCDSIVQALHDGFNLSK